MHELKNDVDSVFRKEIQNLINLPLTHHNVCYFYKTERVNIAKSQ